MAVGTDSRIVYELINYPDRTPIKNLDTGNTYRFDSEQNAEQFIVGNSYLKKRYPSLQVMSRIIYSIYHR